MHCSPVGEANHYVPAWAGAVLSEWRTIWRKKGWAAAGASPSHVRQAICGFYCTYSHRHRQWGLQLPGYHREGFQTAQVDLRMNKDCLFGCSFSIFLYIAGKFLFLIHCRICFRIPRMKIGQWLLHYSTLLLTKSIFNLWKIWLSFCCISESWSEVNCL